MCGYAVKVFWKKLHTWIAWSMHARLKSHIQTMESISEISKLVATERGRWNRVGGRIMAPLAEARCSDDVDSSRVVQFRCARPWNVRHKNRTSRSRMFTSDIALVLEQRMDRITCGFASGSTRIFMSITHVRLHV